MVQAFDEEREREQFRVIQLQLTLCKAALLIKSMHRITLTLSGFSGEGDALFLVSFFRFSSLVLLVVRKCLQMLPHR